MPLRIGVSLIQKQRLTEVFGRGPAGERYFRRDEKTNELDAGVLFTAKCAVIRATGELCLFDCLNFAITKVRGGFAAIPRANKFEKRLVDTGISWISVTFGEVYGAIWALAVGMPGDVPAYEAVIAMRPVGQLLTEDRLDHSTRERFAQKPHADLLSASSHAAVFAAEILLGADLPCVGVSQPLQPGFSHPSELIDIPVSFCSSGNYSLGAVAREARVRTVRIDMGEAVRLVEIT